jgi:hypothetical protein
MPNTKAIGVAFADPQFESLTVTGVSALDAVTATSVATSSDAAASHAVAGVYFYSTAITAGVTTTTAPVGSLGMTSNATGLGKLFYSDGTNWQIASVTP